MIHCSNNSKYLPRARFFHQTVDICAKDSASKAVFRKNNTAKCFILVEKKAKKVHVSSQIHLKDLPLLQ